MSNAIKEFVVAFGVEFNKSRLDAVNRALVDTAKSTTTQITAEEKKRTDVQAKELDTQERKAKQIADNIVRGVNVATFAMKAALAGVAGTILSTAANLGLLSRSLSELQIVSDRTGASAGNIRAYEQAIKQLGGTTDDAMGSIEGLAQSMRTNPGIRGYLKNLGVTETKDTVKMIEQLRGQLLKDSEPVAIRRGELLGLSPEAIRLLRSGDFTKEIAKARAELSAWGTDEEKVTKAGREFAKAWQSLSYQFFAFNRSIATDLLGGSSGILTQLSRWFQQNAGPIRSFFLSISEPLSKWAIAGLNKGMNYLQTLTSDTPEGQKMRDEWVRWFQEIKDRFDRVANVLDRMLTLLERIFDFFTGKKERTGEQEKFLDNFGKFGPKGTGDTGSSSASPSVWSRVKSFFGGSKASSESEAPATGKASGAGNPNLGFAGRRGAGGSALPAKRNEMMAHAMDQLRKEGVPEGNLRAAAAHLVGQADMESGLNPNAVHDGGTGYGIYGARDPTPGRGRRTNMLKWMAGNGFMERNSAEGQMRFMAHEAMTKYAETRRILMGAKPETFESDVPRITKNFESPAVVNYRTGAVRQAFRTGGEATRPVNPGSGASNPNVITVKPSSFDAAKNASTSIDQYDFAKHGMLNTGSSVANNNNSKSISSSPTFNTTINTSGDAKEGATLFQRANEAIVANSQRNLQGAMR